MFVYFEVLRAYHQQRRRRTLPAGEIASIEVWLEGGLPESPVEPGKQIGFSVCLEGLWKMMIYR